jgi:GNAT superfamily N-acetyltransferase
MPLAFADESGRYSLRSVIVEREWETYHTLRRTILFERRGRLGVYDASHADEHAPGNHPFLLWFDREPVGTVRIDVAEGEALFRLVTIREDAQRRGHGRRMLALAEQFVRGQHRSVIRSHVNRNAVGFYERCGFTRDGADDSGATVLMKKHVGAPDA